MFKIFADVLNQIFFYFFFKLFLFIIFWFLLVHISSIVSLITAYGPTFSFVSIYF